MKPVTDPNLIAELESSKAPVKPAPQKPTGEITRMNIGLGSLERTLDEYDQLMKDFNPRNPLQQVNPTLRARAESLQARGQLEAKEATALGALTGPDVKILDKVLANPATIKGAFYGTEGLKEQIAAARQMVKLRRQTMESMGLPVPPEPVAPGAPAAPEAPGQFTREQLLQEARRRGLAK